MPGRAGGGADPSLLLPSPLDAAVRPGALVLTTGTRVAPPAGVTGGVRIAVGLVDRLSERSGLRLEVGAPGSAPGITLVLDRNAGSEGLRSGSRFGIAGTGDGFSLRVSSGGAEIRGEGPAGLRYGAEALAQLTDAGGRIPAARVFDLPALRRRGFLLDISRGRVPTLDSAKELIRRLARLRFNEFYLYTEHTFLFPSHPEIGAGSGGYSAAEISELDAFARALGVELVPCLQTFGHMRRILEKPRYRALAETARLWSLSPEAPGTYRLLEELLGDYLPRFGSGWAHLNCDEPVDLGLGHSADRAAREGMGALFGDHVNRVAAMARDLGKRPMIWADVLADHPDALDRLHPDIVLCDWWYEPDHDFDRVARFREAGREFLTVSGTSSWSSLFPRLDTALPNIRGHASAARRHGAAGTILTDWGDGGHFNLFSGSLYPLAVGAEAAWGDEARPEAELEAAFSEHVAGDPSGFSGSFASRLGRLHGAGFRHFNHSPLKTVFFETRLVRGRRVPTVDALEATQRNLERLARETARCGLPPDPISREWAYALDASRLAAERGLLACRLRDRAVQARSAPDPDLARDLRAVADRQAALLRRFRAAWKASYRPEGGHTAVALHRSAVRALRRAAARIC